MRRYSGVMIGLLAAILIAGTALAEGSWTSYMINVRRGFESRTWWDNANDSVATTVRLDGCRDQVPANDPNDWGTIRLYRHAGIFPPYAIGTDKKLYCYTSATGNWGAQAAPGEWFHFTVMDYSGGTASWNVFDTSFVRVTY